MRFSSLLAITVFIIGLSGCETLKRLNQIHPEEPEPPATRYIPAVSDTTTFVVFPFNDYMHQLQFAALIEQVMIHSGFQVVAPSRGIKEVEERKGAGISEDSSSPNMSEMAAGRTEKQSLLIERYKVAEESKADYIIETMLTGSDGTVKFMRKSDRKVIGVFGVYAYDRDSLKEEMTTQLIRMKFLKEDKSINPNPEKK